MIVSHKHRFIFLKTQKTAGTSIELTLSSLCGDDDIVTPLNLSEEPLRRPGPRNYLRPVRADRWRRADGITRPNPSTDFYNHIPATQVREYLGDQIWRRYFKFAFERNPWDRQVSFYHFAYKNSGRSFEEHLNDPRARMANFNIYAIDRRVAVDFLGRYEALTGDLAAALAHVGVPCPASLPDAKSRFRPEHDDYRGYYTNHTASQIALWYSHEIRHCGYTF